MFGGRFSHSMGLIGIDFGSVAIKLLQVRCLDDGRLRVVGAGRVENPGDPASPPERRLLSQHLRAALSAGGFSGRRCVISLPRHIVRMQSVRLPKMPDPELRQAATWEASQRFGVDRTAMEVELIRTGAELQGSENREEVLLIAVPHDAINAWIEPVMQAGLRPVAVETHFTALARMLGRSQGAREGALAAIDVGTTGSTVMILRDDQIAFCKPIAIGGEHFDQAVAEHLQMDLRTARDLRASRIASAAARRGAEAAETTEADADADGSIDRAVYDAVRPLLSAFAKEVMLCISYYGVAFRGHPPRRLVLTGGGGLEPRLDQVLTEHCKIDVVLDDELSQGVTAILSDRAGPGAWWSVAGGLSLRGPATRGRLGVQEAA